MGGSRRASATYVDQPLRSKESYVRIAGNNTKRLLDSLSPTDKQRSDLMLSVALQNSRSRWTPLAVLAYSYLDDLLDPEFPSPETIKACSEQDSLQRLEKVKR